MKKLTILNKRDHLIILWLLFCMLPLLGSPVDLGIEELKTSLHTNTEILLLQEEIYQLQLDVKDAKANFWPNIELDFSATWMANPSMGPITISTTDLNWALGNANVPNLPSITLFDGMESLLYSTGITLNQPIFTWGKRSHALKLSQSLLQVKRYELQNRTMTLSSEIETRLTTVTHLKNILMFLQQQEQLAQELVNLALQATQSGMSLALEVAETRLQVQQITIAKLEIQRAIDTQILALRKLSGKKDLRAEEIFQSHDEKALSLFLETPISVLVAKALAADQPALLTVSTFEQVTAEAEKIAKGDFYGKPDLALVIRATYGGSKFPVIENDWQKKDDYDFNISIGFKTTLFDGGKVLNAIRRAASQSESARIQSQSVRQQIEHEVRENHLNLTMTVEKLHLQQVKTDTLIQRKLLNQQLSEAGFQGKQQTLIAEIEAISSQIEEEQLKITLCQYINTLKTLT